MNMIDEDYLTNKFNEIVPHLLKHNSTDIWDPVLDQYQKIMEIRVIICDMYGIDEVKHSFEEANKIFPSDFESYYRLIK